MSLAANSVARFQRKFSQPDFPGAKNEPKKGLTQNSLAHRGVTSAICHQASTGIHSSLPSDNQSLRAQRIWQTKFQILLSLPFVCPGNSHRESLKQRCCWSSVLDWGCSNQCFPRFVFTDKLLISNLFLFIALLVSISLFPT